MDFTINEENQGNTACPTNRTDVFSQSNLDSCEKYVLSIQRRLDKAVANGDKSRIKWYSHILSKRSRAVKILAVHRVCKENQGRHTAGVDGVYIPKDKDEAHEMMLGCLDNIDITKRPEPIRRVYIPKPNGDTRPLGIPTIADRITQDIIRRSIEPICEFNFNHQSYGFRPKRSCQDAMSNLFNKLSSRTTRKWIVEGDIKGCFNHIRHDHIISTLEGWNVSRNIRNIIQQMLKSGVMENDLLSTTPGGIPQDGIIGPMLANVALNCLDYEMEKAFSGTQSNPIVRYADDFIVVAKSRLEAEAIKRHIKDFLKDKVGLELSDRKTHITHIDDGFDFLGFNFRAYKEKLLIKPSKDNVNLLKQKIKRTVRECTSAVSLITTLNPILTGWGNYYRHVASKATFKGIDNFLWKQIWRWIAKKHPTRTKKYRKSRYFDEHGTRRWQFMDRDTNLRIVFMKHIPIKRFVQVKGGQRVFDADAKDYWQKREHINAKNSIYAETAILTLFGKQKGRCEYCHKNITQDDVQNRQIHKHHFVPRCEGGQKGLGNLRLLHRECHTKLHSQVSRKDMARFARNGIDYLRILNQP